MTTSYRLVHWLGVHDLTGWDNCWQLPPAQAGASFRHVLRSWSPTMGLNSVMTQNYYFSANQNAKRLHGVPIYRSPFIYSCCSMYSPHVMSIPYMTNKNRNRRRVVVQPPKQKKQPATPFADAGAIAGSKLGTMFNLPYLKGVGKWLGSGIGQIFGSGDYQIVGNQPGYNVLMNGAQIPKFSTSKQTNIICHREYLGDILGTAGFNNTAYPLNPGMATTFPWLATIAQCYQEYKFHGVIFEFRPLITDFVTNGAPGVVVMATNYNADAAIYNTKQEMENSEYAVSVKPTRELMHGVECATVQTVLPQLYVRSGTPPTGQDLRLYDLGNFQFATQANPVQNLGELWVSYCVEFFKPILPTDVGGNVLSTLTNRGSFSGGSPLGTIQSSISGDLGATFTNTTITWVGQPGNVYLISINWLGTIAALLSWSGYTLSGLTQLSVYNNKTVNAIITPQPGVSTIQVNFTATMRCDNLVPGPVTMTFNAGTVLPTGTTFVTVQVTNYSSEAI